MRKTKTWPPPEGGLVRVNGQIGRLVGCRDGRCLGAYLVFSVNLPPAERPLRVGTAMPLPDGQAHIAREYLPTDNQMEAMAQEYGLRKKPTT